MEVMTGLHVVSLRAGLMLIIFWAGRCGWCDPELSMGWVDLRVGLGWVGLDWVEIFRFLVGWVGSTIAKVLTI